MRKQHKEFIKQMPIGTLAKIIGNGLLCGLLGYFIYLATH